MTTPYSPQQNGIVERRNQTVIGMARCLLKAKGVPAEFWGEAVTTAVYLLNRAPTVSVVGKNPFEAWFGWQPDVHYLRTFGCIGHVKTVSLHLKKLDDRSRRMVMFGYEPGSKAYRMYDPVARRIHVTRDVVFDEEAAWNWGETSNDDNTGMTDSFTVEYVVHTAAPTPHGALTPAPSGEEGDPMPAPSTPVTPTAPQQVQVEFATPPMIEPELFDNDDNVNVPHRYRTVTNVLDAGAAPRLNLLLDEEPVNHRDAAQYEWWQRAMSEEMQSIEANDTWRLVSLPEGQRAIGLKWVYKVKKDSRGK